MTRIRHATLDDLDALLRIEARCFEVDRLSRRSFRRWLQAKEDFILLVESEGQVIAYGLIWCLKGTRLARLYSLAILPEARGQGLGDDLLQALETEAGKRDRLFMRLEVASTNLPAIKLYQRNGYRVFGEYHDYYEDHSDALRMQKTIHAMRGDSLFRSTIWYRQTTDFTCGPAALMMAMNSLDDKVAVDQAEELSIWREATTIFMTSGHGGSHPIGLANAAKERGLEACVYLNTREPLFLSGVRSESKKQILELVHAQFIHKAERLGAVVKFEDFSQADLWRWLKEGCAVVALISTYRLDGKKAPHWVTVTAMDEKCLYVHDPDYDEQSQRALDCQHIPIARDDFARMSVFGKERLRTAVVLKNPGVVE